MAVRKENGILFNIDSQAPNKVIKEWLAGQAFGKVIPEHTYGNSRVDFYMERGNQKYLMEVKGCTLEMDGVTEVRPNTATHPEFAAAFAEAVAAGVQILMLPCHVEPDRLEILPGFEV